MTERSCGCGLTEMTVFCANMWAMTGREDGVDNGVPTRVGRHLEALRTVDEYKAAYFATNKQIN
ncbi:hypothetical protein PHMEG_0007940 [Phytophthora megakarya]|uniref:Uncharacterized protein n=1 Tax=Phytophthora megakarya TaxID=4795 RepID=A0A225WK78_9STRA|nr:hypothetical protein PHMEG_0007940 [Phytophthora megakarya]